MLMDILGVLIAFVTTMLMFSLLVTTLVQFTQSLFKQRYLNLLVGMDILEQTVNNTHITQIIDERINTFSKLSLKPWQTLGLKILDIEKEDILNALDSMAGVEADVKASLKSDIENLYPKIENFMSKRYKVIMDYFSIFFAFIIAFTFQLNTPALLKELNANAEYRHQLVNYGEELAVSRVFSKQEKSTQKQETIDTAVEQLLNQYPKHQHLLETLPGSSASLQANISALSLMLTKHDLKNSQAIQSSFQELLAAAFLAEHQHHDMALAGGIHQMSLYDFKLLPQGWAYYFSLDWRIIGHWFGVLMSAIFISLGAPFWFDTLQSLFKIREQVKAK